MVGVLERNKPRNLTLGAPTDAGEHLSLDIVVHAMGRINFGCVWDYKGLVNPDIKLDGALVLTAWHGAPPSRIAMHGIMEYNPCSYPLLDSVSQIETFHQVAQEP